MRVAICQFAATPDVSENLATISGFARTAQANNARVLVCPEGAMIRLPDKNESLVGKVEDLDGFFGSALKDISKSTGVAIIAGGFTLGDSTRVTNTLFVADHGQIIEHYDKIHLYDAFEDKESNKVLPGKLKIKTANIDGIVIGLAICYDLRFPELFRLLAVQGAQIIVIPAAWVKGSMKEEHWLTLLRARAIENTTFVVGSGECGTRCIGRSAAFDPLGRQLTDLGGDTRISCVDLQVTELSTIRRTNPSLKNRRILVTVDRGMNQE